MADRRSTRRDVLPVTTTALISFVIGVPLTTSRPRTATPISRWRRSPRRQRQRQRTSLRREATVAGLGLLIRLGVAASWKNGRPSVTARG